MRLTEGLGLAIVGAHFAGTDTADPALFEASMNVPQDGGAAEPTIGTDHARMNDRSSPPMRTPTVACLKLT